MPGDDAAHPEATHFDNQGDFDGQRKQFRTRAAAMKRDHSIAVVLLRTAGFNNDLTLSDVQAVMDTRSWSVLDFWRQNSAGWFRFTTVDYFGPYEVEFPLKMDPTTKVQSIDGGRGTSIEIARAQMRADGHDPLKYDHIVVFLDPSGPAYDGGAWGDSCALGVHDTHTFFAHEVGHILGFDHTYGIATDAANWDDPDTDGITLYPEYGDPFDIMSAQRFGGTWPTHLRNSVRQRDFTNAHSVGPMAARAMVWLYGKDILESRDLVAYQLEDARMNEWTLHRAGLNEHGKTELVVFRPRGATDEENDVGSVMVEYRRPADYLVASTWDQGLSDDPADIDACGVVVHVVEPVTIGPQKSRVATYRTRLPLAGLQQSVVVETPRGHVMVVVDLDEFNARSASVKVRVGPPSAFAPTLSIISEFRDVDTVVSQELSPAPVGSGTMMFTRERVRSVRHATYRAEVRGFPAVSTHGGPMPVAVTWRVGGVVVSGVADHVISVLDEAGASRRLSARQDADHATLTVNNELEGGSFAVAIEATALQDSVTAVATARFEATADFERWGQDYSQFFEVFDRLWTELPQPGPSLDPQELVWSSKQLVKSLGLLDHRFPALADAIRPSVSAHLDQVRKILQPQLVSLPHHLLDLVEPAG